MAEGKMVEWHHRFNEREFEQTLGDGEGQESLACCSPWGCKESDCAGLPAAGHHSRQKTNRQKKEDRT